MVTLSHLVPHNLLRTLHLFFFNLLTKYTSGSELLKFKLLLNLSETELKTNRELVLNLNII